MCPARIFLCFPLCSVFLKWWLSSLQGHAPQLVPSLSLPHEIEREGLDVCVWLREEETYYTQVKRSAKKRSVLRIFLFLSLYSVFSSEEYQVSKVTPTILSSLSSSPEMRARGFICVRVIERRRKHILHRSKKVQKKASARFFEREETYSLELEKKWKKRLFPVCDFSFFPPLFFLKEIDFKSPSHTVTWCSLPFFPGNERKRVFMWACDWEREETCSVIERGRNTFYNSLKRNRKRRPAHVFCFLLSFFL